MVVHMIDISFIWLYLNGLHHLIEQAFTVIFWYTVQTDYSVKQLSTFNSEMCRKDKYSNSDISKNFTKNLIAKFNIYHFLVQKKCNLYMLPQ